jgi:eukaryotic-like serine/threonine-protein kinase
LSLDLRAQLQQTLGDAYVLERELGGGGMSRVFVANEVRLDRKVVVKVLSPDLAQGLSVDRFEREIKTVAALQQANIVPVLTAGDTDGLPFYTMPFVDGESLRAHIARGPLSITTVIGVLRDVSKALAYAHRQGVVHRDIKPDNVLLSEGTAVVTDFGIAKAISAARTSSGGATLTQMGTSIGTPAYMAPEQAAGDPQIDHRADIYSLGAMAYELLCGHAVFANRTPQRMLAAHMSEAPVPISELRADMPASLAELVMSCLDKEPGKRPQQAGDIVRALETITSGGSMQAMPPVLLGGPGMFRKALAIYAGAFVIVAIVAKAAIVGIGLPDWVFPGSLIVMALGLPVVLWTGYVQRVTRRALAQTPTYTPGGTPSLTHGTIATMALKAAPNVSWYKTARGGMYALGTFIGIIAAFMVMRAFGIGPAGSLMGKGTFGENETIVVADFKSPASDSTLGMVASEALRTDFAQSTSLKVLTKSAVGDVLRLMKKPPDAQVPFDLAREVATREGAKAVLNGEISQLGDQYVIAATLVGALDGTELAQFRETAKSQNDLVEALGRLSKDIREKIGESLRNVRQSNPLERVTTSSLPALRKYVEGVDLAAAGDNEAGRASLEEAVALDSTFAMAWRRLAATYGTQTGGQAAAQRAISQAFRFRDRLSDDERLLTEAGYYDWGPTPDRERAIAAYEGVIARDSTNRAALNNVGSLYFNKRDFAHAEDRYRRATLVSHPFGGSFTNLTNVQIVDGKLDAADSTVARFGKTFPSHSELPSVRAAIIAARGDVAKADSSLRAAMPQIRSPESRSISWGILSNFETTRGQLHEGQHSTSLTIVSPAGTPAGLAELQVVMLDSAWVQAFFYDDATAARATIKRALAKVPMESLGPADRPWFALLTVATAMHDGAAARSYDASLEKDLPTSGYSQLVGIREAVRGLVALAENRPKDAVDFLGVAHKNDIGREQLGPWRAQAFDLANQPDSAIVEFEKYVKTGDPIYSTKRNFLAPSYKRLGELYETTGNTAKAIENYRKFVELWKNADPELQPQVKAVREKLAKLTPVEKTKP